MYRKTTPLGFRRLTAAVLLLGCSGHLAFAVDDYAAAYSAYQQQAFTEAEAIWSELAVGGDANAQYALAVMHLKGETVTPDPVASFRLLQEAAEQAHTTAMFNLGIAFWEGVGTEADRQQAMDWWHQAAAKGEAGAQYNLGLIYYIGEQQSQDLEQARQWLASAAAAKHPEAGKLLHLIEQEINAEAPAGGESSETAFAIPAPPPIMERAPLMTESDAQPVVVDEPQSVTQNVAQLEGLDDKQPAAPIGEEQPVAATETEPTQQYWRTVEEAALHPTAQLLEPILALLPENTPVEILQQQSLASKVAIPGGVPLWVFGKYVTAEGDRGTINANAVNARPLPNTDKLKSPPAGQFQRDDQVSILEIQGEWVRVRAPAHLGVWLDNGKLAQYSDSPTGRTSAWESAASRGF